jgi:hypothetical protein
MTAARVLITLGAACALLDRGSAFAVTQQLARSFRGASLPPSRKATQDLSSQLPATSSQKFSLYSGRKALRR